MRRVRYQVACSLDGYIAGPNGEYDWITIDPDIDFAGLYAQFDTLVMGRGTYEIINAASPEYAGQQIIVFSRTMRPEDHPGVTVVAEGIKETMDELRARPGKDIWLYGGGKLFRSMMELGCVDTIEPAIIPIVLGEGIPMFPAGYPRSKLKLAAQKLYEKSGTLLLQYEVL